MKKILKAVIIAVTIIFFSLLIGFLIYVDRTTESFADTQLMQPHIAVPVNSCFNVTFNFVTDENASIG